MPAVLGGHIVARGHILWPAPRPRVVMFANINIHVREFTRHVDEQQRRPIFMFVNMAF